MERTTEQIEAAAALSGRKLMSPEAARAKADDDERGLRLFVRFMEIQIAGLRKGSVVDFAEYLIAELPPAFTVEEFARLIDFFHSLAAKSADYEKAVNGLIVEKLTGRISPNLATE